MQGKQAQDPENAGWLHALIASWHTACALAVIVATLPGIDVGGDAAWKWAFVRTWGLGLPWVYDHHTARFAVNVPVYLCQRTFGSGPNVMYVAPILFASLQIPLCYAIGRRVACAATGSVAVCCLIAFGPWRMAAAQLLPSVFQTTYLLAAIYAFVRFSEREARGWLVGLGSALLAGYLAMLSTLYFVPGFVVAVYLVRRRVSDVALWLGVLLCGIAIETALYAWLGGLPGGQLQIVERTHQNVAPIAFWDLFKRYAVLPAAWQGALSFGALSGLLVLALAPAAVWRGVPLVAGAFLFASTFGIKQLHPLVPALNFRDRYFDPVAPLIALTLPMSVVLVVRALQRRRRARAAAGGSKRALLLQLVAPALIAALVILHEGVSGPRVLADNARVAGLLSRAYLTQQAIVADNPKDHDQIKTLTVVAYAFLDDDAFHAQPAPRKPQLRRLQLGKRSYRFLSTTELTPEGLKSALRKERCGVFVSRRVSPPQLIVREDGPCALAVR